MNHPNYIPVERKAEIEMLIEADAIKGPAFIGCGWTKHVGSDSYGGYVVSIGKTSKGKPLVGLVQAHSEFGPDGWTAGIEHCSLPNGKDRPEDCEPTEWITTYGKRKNGLPKWYFCDKEGNRFVPGRRCGYSWGHAIAYSDPSF